MKYFFKILLSKIIWRQDRKCRSLFLSIYFVMIKTGKYNCLSVQRNYHDFWDWDVCCGTAQDWCSWVSMEKTCSKAWLLGDLHAAISIYTPLTLPSWQLATVIFLFLGWWLNAWKLWMESSPCPSVTGQILKISVFIYMVWFPTKVSKLLVYL